MLYEKDIFRCITPTRKSAPKDQYDTPWLVLNQNPNKGTSPEGL